MNQSTEERLISILKRELIPAMGCTEPIAIALAAAKAREVLGTEPKKIRVGCSSNIIKNVKSVTIPGTHGLHGIEAAAVAGAFAGKPEADMQVLAEVTEDRKDITSERLKEGICSSSLPNFELPSLLSIRTLPFFSSNTRLSWSSRISATAFSSPEHISTRICSA